MSDTETRLPETRGFGRIMSLALVAASLVSVTFGLILPDEGTARSKPRPMVTGVSYVNHNGDPENAIQFERVRDSGAKMVHTWLRWNVIAPEVEPASWNPSDPADPNYD